MPYRKTPEVFWCYKCRFVSFHCLQKPIEHFCFRKLRVTIANKRDFFFCEFSNFLRYFGNKQTSYFRILMRNFCEYSHNFCKITRKVCE